jgi:hypothetical protein
VLTGLRIKDSSCLAVWLVSTLVDIEGRDLVVPRETFDAFSEARLESVLLDMLESREGGRASGKVAVAGDCMLEDGLDVATGEDMDTPPGLRLTAAGLDAGEVALLPSCDCSLAPPTEALRRLYKPLKPPCTRSMPLGSLTELGAGGTVKSSKVVSVSERDAWACIWCSEGGCSDPRRESLDMATVTGVMVSGCRVSCRMSRDGSASDSGQ